MVLSDVRESYLGNYPYKYLKVRQRLLGIVYTVAQFYYSLSILNKVKYMDV